MRRRTLLVVSAAAVVIAGIGIGVWYHQSRDSPAHALQEIRQAVSEKNVLKFERRVRVDRFAKKFVSDAVSTSTLDALSSGGSGWEVLGQAAGLAVTDATKPALVNELASSIREAVEAGRADSVLPRTAAGLVRAAGRSDEEGLKLTAVGSSSSDSTVVANTRRYQGSTGIKQEGDLAIAGFRFQFPSLDTTVAFRVKMEKTDGRWQVVEPYNLTRLVNALSTRRDTLLARERRRLDSLRRRRDSIRAAKERRRRELTRQANRRLRAQADSMIEFGDIKNFYIQGCQDQSAIVFPVINTSPYEISEIKAALYKDGERVSSQLLRGPVVAPKTYHQVDVLCSWTGTMAQALENDAWTTIAPGEDAVVGGFGVEFREGTPDAPGLTPRVEELVFTSPGGDKRVIRQLESWAEYQQFAGQSEDEVPGFPRQ